eukprot:Gregarina_sp_Pseudo_9__5292@NODE_611_length_2492_cov_31_114961_g577_i0_p1_GENE_NODE_611_length_2492_cov_31_114961_g577_i0NODE_611_length_2492_cov_31_114961_g577_i0_p1_ORF_typecomplete_len676_score126_56ABC2_membrane/PF01061_24/1_9e34ABC_tran/PF00005_27/1_2e29AAA_21/PF13304_6/2e07SMC_N/PF02463_19/6_9SMC_N/PF02463_19/9_1e05AAA_15/PF13175_6/0_00026ABC2_membrane_3/PF12698_7/1e03ABC2_membrane_3/PF12698_7/4_5e05RsgA_GTPase/PF03193_16/9_5e05AAA_29/PF13555_6/0_00024Rad17/PF03215_15/0_002T2SSE/PF00437_20
MISLAVDSLYYNMVGGDGPSKMILSNVHMICKPGTLTGIMGPSGSGKTTLLNVLAGRVKLDIESADTHLDAGRSQITGTVLLNGNAVGHTETREHSKYVMQRDELLGYLTVDETIRYCAYLKMRGEKRASQDAKAERVISDLGLQSCRHVLIGDEETKGVSGGQKKRVSVALELLTDPSLLFLDEPTSGLDSSLAFDVMKVLSRLAKQGKTIIATIHQPRPQIFEMLDNLLLLAEGQVIYHGPARDVSSYLATVGHPVPTGYSTSDFLLDLLTPNEKKSELTAQELSRPPSRIHSKLFDSKMTQLITGEASRLAVVGAPSLLQSTAKLRSMSIPTVDLPIRENEQCDIVGRPGLTQEEFAHLPMKYRNSTWYSDNIRTLTELEANPTPLPPIEKAELTEAALMFCSAVCVLLHRFVKERLRKPSTFVVQFITTAWMGFFCGFIWYQTPEPTVDNIDCNRFFALMGALGWNVLEVTWNIFSMIVAFPECRPLFNREVANKMYPPSAFYLARILSDLPFICCTACIHMLPAYWLVGYNTNSMTTFYFFISAIINSFCASGFILMMAAFSRSCTVSSVATAVGMVALSLNFGYFITVDAMPVFWRDLKYISWMYYSYTGIQLQLFKDDLEVLEVCSPELDTTQSAWRLVGLSVVLGIGFRMIGFVGLKYTNRRIGMES